MYKMGHIIIQIRKGYSILCSYRLPNNDFINIIEFIPVLITEIESIIIFNILYLSKEIGTYPGFISLIKGSNFGPPGIAMFKALAVKKLFVSKR